MMNLESEILIESAGAFRRFKGTRSERAVIAEMKRYPDFTRAWVLVKLEGRGGYYSEILQSPYDGTLVYSRRVYIPAFAVVK